jgi:hypothetical protein
MLSTNTLNSVASCVRDTLWLPVSVFNANKPIFTFQILHSKHQSKGNGKKERKEKEQGKEKENPSSHHAI